MTSKSSKLPKKGAATRAAKRLTLPNWASLDELMAFINELHGAAMRGQTVRLASSGSIASQSELEATGLDQEISKRRTAWSRRADQLGHEWLAMKIEPDYEAVRAGIKERRPGFVTLDLAGPSPEDNSVSFGSVTVKGRGPAPATVKRNIASGQSALERSLSALIKPGVKLPRVKNIPMYRADPNDPTILIRELNGRDERGTLTGGEFKIAK
jgi:hypothetical protein